VLRPCVEFLVFNRAGFNPAVQDGDVAMVEPIAIMECLMVRYRPTRCTFQGR
jgi:glutathione S-transferase